MFSMFRFLMGDKSVVCRIIRLRRIECKMCFEVIGKLREL